jgi:hypothetical protein
VFISFLLDPQSRMLLETGRFAEFRARDANLYGSQSELSPPEKEALVGYLQSQVPLEEFDEVAWWSARNIFRQGCAADSHRSTAVGWGTDPGNSHPEERA